MNEFEREEPVPLQDEALDRYLDCLVDGELSDSQRRELLLGLDGIANGWRRCALAFIEAQAWRREFSALLAAPQAVAAPSAGVIGPRPSRQFGLSTIFALAATFLVAFTLGLAMQGARALLPGVSTRPEQLAAMPVHSGEKSTNTHLASTDRPARETAVDTIWLPAETEDSDATASLPTQLVQQFQQLGHDVQHRQELWPVELANGHRAVLPIERIDVRFVGNEYQ
jgi:hypothetical protein